jgi:hypothetical protein
MLTPAEYHDLMRGAREALEKAKQAFPGLRIHEANTR